MVQVKAFKGMSAPKVANLNNKTAGLQVLQGACLSNSESQITASLLCIQEEKYPLDLSLKTTIRFTSNMSFERSDQCLYTYFSQAINVYEMKYDHSISSFAFSLLD